MESLKLLSSLLIVQFSFTFMSYAICWCCCTGIRRQQERKAFHLISKMAGCCMYLHEEVIFDSLYCRLASAIQWK